MVFELMGDWPVDPALVPAGTVIDGNDPQWNGIAIPFPMPMNAKALDQDAADALSRWWPHHLHLLFAARGCTIREIIKV